MVLSESVKAEAVPALADLLLEAAGQFPAGGEKKRTSDEPQD